MRLIRTDSFYIKSKPPFSEWPQIVHQFFREQGLSWGKFYYFFEELSLKACPRAVKDCPGLGEPVLVNGSGFGRFGAFTDIDLAEQEQMITLNASALMSMTYLTLPYMSKGGQIYQIDSQSAFQPVPYIATYGATKAFVLSFSRALNKELEKRKIKRNF